MDQRKIGKFIADQRKLIGLTQLQLAERMGITDRAVSKWETGRSLPDSAIMPELCELLQITVNDLLSGEIIDKDHYTKELEAKLIELMKQKEESDKKLLSLEWAIAALSLVVIFIPILIAELIPMEEWKATWITFSGLLPGLVGLMLAMRIEQMAGYYQCKHCKHKYVPSYRTLSISMHLSRTRYMKCPACGKYSWQKKVIRRDQP